MFATITNAHSRLWSTIENRFIPFPEGSEDSKFFHILPLALELPLGLALSLIHALNKTTAYLVSFSPWPQLPDPQTDFSSVLQDSRQWEKLGDFVIKLGHKVQNFMYGVATCTYQDSRCPDSQWEKFQLEKLPENNRSGKSANLFELYQTPAGRKKLTDALHKLRVNAYRFSIEWSQIQPKLRDWKSDKLRIYVDLCKHLRDEGIEPIVTFAHFSEPPDFHENGSFENEVNIYHFVEFASAAFSELAKDYNGKLLVEKFFTINEPAIDAFSRYIRGAWPPHIFLNFKRAANFLKGAFKAHALVYDQLKQINPNAKIGIIHQYLKFIPTNPLLFPVTHYLTRFINDVSLNYFRSCQDPNAEYGTFEFTMPFVNVTDKQMPKAKVDFVGTQYYVRPVIGLLGPTGYHTPMTLMPFCEDPEGLYEAIIETHEAYNAPVIVTENGISTNDDAQRSRYFKRALYAAEQAAKVIGEENLQGYLAWSFTDNFEWDMGMNPQRFGAYSKDGVANGEEPKPGMAAFIQAAKDHQSRHQPSEKIA